MNKVVAISGSSGFLGSALTEFLPKFGFKTKPLHLRWPNAILASELEGVDIVINLAGRNIAKSRWSQKQKQLIYDSRVKNTELLSHALAKRQVKPALFISQSATGYYGQGFLATVCKDWEAATKPAEKAGIRVVHTRTGMVLAKHNGALARMLLAYYLGLGGPMGSGQQFVSWISLHDYLNAMLFVINHESIADAVDLSAPNPTTNQQFATALARALHRPHFLRLPASILKLALGELSDSLLESIRVEPKKLTQAGFRFSDDSLETAFERIFNASKT